MNSQFGDTGKSRVKSKSRKQTSMFITMLCNREGLYLVSECTKYSKKVFFYEIRKGFLRVVLLFKQVSIDRWAMM